MSQSNTEGKKFKRSRIISDFKIYQNESKSIIGKNEIDAYLEEPAVDDDEDNEDFDVLKYWKTNEKKFAILSIIIAASSSLSSCSIIKIIYLQIYQCSSLVTIYMKVFFSIENLFIPL